jgi:carboxyl-terminal processing protease
VDDHRDEIRSAYPTINDYLEGFKVGDDILEDLVAYGTEEGLPLSEEDLEISRERIRIIMKAYLARDLWNTSEFYQVVNTSEPSVLKAIELLMSHEIYQALLEVK